MRKKAGIILILFFLFGVKVSAFDIDGYRAKITELKEMLSECKDLGMECPYEEMYIAVMEQFSDGEELANEEYVENCLDEIYEKAKTELSAYLKGEGTPIQVPSYVSSDISISGNVMEAETTWGVRPVFFVGYGHFTAAREAFDIFPKIGANITQQEIGVWDVIFEAKKPYGWEIHSSGGAEFDISSEFDETNVRGGEVSLKIELASETQGGRYVMARQEYKIEPNTNYICSFSAKCSDDQSVYLKPGSSAERIYLDKSSDWKSYRYSFTSGDETENSFLILSDRKSLSYIDNISVMKEGDTQNLLNNGNFEKNADRFGDNGEYIAVTDKIENEIIPMLDNAEKNNIAVSLLISPHYFPLFVNDYYPDFNIYHRQHEIIMDKYIETLIPLVEGKQALSDICISNEPSSNSAKIESLLPDYRDWLLKKYEGIDNLNNAFGTKYGSIDEIYMPSEVSQTREFYDWMDYNDTKYAAWHKRIADKIRTLAPNIKIHSKMQDYFAQDGSVEFERNRLFYGTDAEKFAEFSDLMGNDSHAYYKDAGRPIQGKLKWYDYLSSLKEVPVFNSEDHIIPDYSTLYEKGLARFVSADIFQGALHGRAASVIWVWEKTGNPESLFYGNILQRPDALSAIGKASLDLNRLAYEINAFNEKDSDTAILYSNIERVYNKNYITAMDRVYDACLYAGQRPDFIIESNLEKLKNYEVLIVPNITHADEELKNAVSEFKNLGKKVVLAGNCFIMDEYGKESYFDKSGCVEVALDNSLELSEIIFNNCADNLQVKVCDENGELLNNLEWRAVEYNGKILVNICNYSYNDISGVRVLYRGKEVYATDLISNVNLEKEFLAKSFEPMLLMLDTEDALKIEDAYLKQGQVVVNVCNVGDIPCEVRLTAEYCDKYLNLKQAGGIMGKMEPEEIIEGAFSFKMQEEGYIKIKLFDNNGYLVEEKILSVKSSCI